MTAHGFYTANLGAYLSSGAGGSCEAKQYSTEGIEGKTTGAFALEVYKDGSYHTVGLNFKNGILVGASGF
jgi:hypothetical protein